MQNNFQSLINTNKKFIPEIEKALLNTFFSDWDQKYLQSEEGRADIATNAFKRYEHSLRHVVPWLSRQIDLDGKNVLEIGCGTGSSTAALAHFVNYIEAYDIHTLSVQGAQKRLEIMGLDNVRLHVISEENLIDQLARDSQGKFDLILLFAVLEHQTIDERHATLNSCWNLLQDDGIMAIVDTPNLLHYFDLHTSKLPFLHLLPSRLYAKYAENSPRVPFVKSFNDEKERTDSQLDLDIARWGRGVSYHDFELSLGKRYKEFLVAEGFEPEILDWFACTPEEEILRWYIQHKDFDIPLGFTRCVLNLVFKKFTLGDGSTVTASSSFSAPEPVHFLHDSAELARRLKKLEDDLQYQRNLLEEVYASKTWRMGNLFATIYRIIEKILRTVLIKRKYNKS